MTRDLLSASRSTPTFRGVYGRNASPLVKRQGAEPGNVVWHQGPRLPQHHRGGATHVLDAWTSGSAELLAQRGDELRLERGRKKHEH